MIELEYELREQDLLAFSQLQFEENPGIQKSMRKHQATIPGIIIVIALFYWFYYQDVLSALYMGIIGAAWGMLVPIYVKKNLLNQVRKLYSDEEKAKLLGKHTLRVLPKQLAEITPSGESRVEWADIIRIEATKKYAFVYLDIDQAIIIPRKTISNGDLKEFIEIADEHIEAAE